MPYPDSENVKNGLRILPGVVQDAFTGIHLNGAPEHEVLFLLDGFNIGDPLTGRYNPRISVDAVRSINVMSGPISAEFGKGSAGAIEIVTNTGDDRRRYSAATFVPVINNQKGWRVLDWTPRVTVSGPIKAGRAWFTNNASGDFHQYVVPELPRGDDQSWRARFSDHLHAQVNPTSTNMLHASALVSAAWGKNALLSALDPISTTLDTRSRQVLVNVRDQQMLAGGGLFEVGFGSNRTYLRQEPKGRARVSQHAGRPRRQSLFRRASGIVARSGARESVPASVHARGRASDQDRRRCGLARVRSGDRSHRDPVVRRGQQSDPHDRLRGQRHAVVVERRARRLRAGHVAHVQPRGRAARRARRLGRSRLRLGRVAAARRGVVAVRRRRHAHLRRIRDRARRDAAAPVLARRRSDADQHVLRTRSHHRRRCRRGIRRRYADGAFAAIDLRHPRPISPARMRGRGA